MKVKITINLPLSFLRSNACILDNVENETDAMVLFCKKYMTFTRIEEDEGKRTNRET